MHDPIASGDPFSYAAILANIRRKNLPFTSKYPIAVFTCIVDFVYPPVFFFHNRPIGQDLIIVSVPLHEFDLTIKQKSFDHHFGVDLGRILFIQTFAGHTA